MANRQTSETIRSKVLRAAAKLFLEEGYEKATIVRISEVAGVNRGSLCFTFKDKESMLCELVSYVLELQFKIAEEMTAGKTENKILFYAVETTLQLYLAESLEQMREMYNVSYSMTNSANVIYRYVSERLRDVFAPSLPKWEVKDFYEREIAAAGVMRNFISVPCDVYFTMDRKIRAFLESTLLLFRVPDKKIAEAVAFVEGFDWEAAVKDTMERLPAHLESKV